MIKEENVKLYCRDDLSKIENYDKAMVDTTHTWHCHHRLELTLDGEFAHTKDELIRLGMYYDRPYFELIFLKPSEHMYLHNTNRGDEHRKKISESHKGKTRRPLSEETRKKMSEAKKGKTRRPFSDETKRKMSEAKHNISEETRKKVGEAKKGKHWKLVDGKRVWY